MKFSSNSPHFHCLAIISHCWGDHTFLPLCKMQLIMLKCYWHPAILLLPSYFLGFSFMQMHIFYHLAVFICGTRAFKVCQYFFSYLNTDIRWLADTDTGRKVFARKCYSISYRNNNTYVIVSQNKVVKSNTLRSKSAFRSLSFWRRYNSQPVKAQVVIQWRSSLLFECQDFDFLKSFTTFK